MHDATNKAAKFIIDYCVAEKIGNIVFGWNKGQSQRMEMGRKNKTLEYDARVLANAALSLTLRYQQFATIPTGKLKERLKQLCSSYGIHFHETEESYTSKSSFFDHDALHIFGEKPESWKASGKRTKRGLYITGTGFHISSDANGACNILRKIALQIGISLSKISVNCCQILDRVYLWKRSREQKNNVKVQQLAAKAIAAD